MLIVGFGQFVDLTDGGGLANTFSVLLDSGEVVSIKTDEGTVQQLIQLTGSSPPSIPAEEEDGVGGFIDEGVDPEWGDLDGVEDVPSPTPTPLPQPQPVLAVAPAPRPVVDSDGFLVQPRARVVPKDSMGYPVTEKPVISRPPFVDEDVGEQI